MNKSIYQLINEAAGRKLTRAQQEAATRDAATQRQKEHDARKEELEAEFKKRGLHENKPRHPGEETDTKKLSSYYKRLHGFMADAANRSPEYKRAALAVAYNHGVDHHLAENGLPHELVTGLVKKYPDAKHMGVKHYP